MVGDDDRPAGRADLLLEVACQEVEAAQRGVAAAAGHVRHLADHDPQVHEVDGAPVPRVMHAVGRHVRQRRAGPCSARRSSLPPGRRRGGCRGCRGPRRREASAGRRCRSARSRRRTRPTRSPAWRVGLVAAVDAVAGVDDAAGREHAAAAGVRGDGRSGQPVEGVDQAAADRGRLGVEPPRGLLVGEVVGVADEEEGDRAGGRAAARAAAGRAAADAARNRRRVREASMGEAHGRKGAGPGQSPGGGIVLYSRPTTLSTPPAERTRWPLIGPGSSRPSPRSSGRTCRSTRPPPPGTWRRCSPPA